MPHLNTPFFIFNPDESVFALIDFDLPLQIIGYSQDLNVKIDIESISYARLMNHIKFLIIRLNTNEQLQMDISEFTKDKFPFAYEQAIRMCDNLSKVLHKELPESEVGYLALHLERILSSAFQN